MNRRGIIGPESVAVVSVRLRHSWSVKSAKRGLSACSVEGPLTTSYPIAAVMPLNKSSVLGDSDDEVSLDEEESVSSSLHKRMPFSVSHLVWQCAAECRSSGSDLSLNGLIDNGSHTVLIDAKVANRLGLRLRSLPSPMNIVLAMSSSDSVSNSVSDSESVTQLTQWVKLKLFDR